MEVFDNMINKKCVGYTGFEPVTSALSRQRSKPTELITLFLSWQIYKKNYKILLFTKKKPLKQIKRFFNQGWVIGLEPTTFGTTIRRSNQLNYTHRFFVLANIKLFLKIQDFPINFFSLKILWQPQRLLLLFRQFCQGLKPICYYVKKVIVCPLFYIVRIFPNLPLLRKTS